mgnify:CR=1 FL=1
MTTLLQDLQWTNVEDRKQGTEVPTSGGHGYIFGSVSRRVLWVSGTSSHQLKERCRRAHSKEGKSSCL